MLDAGRSHLFDAPHLTVFPGLAIAMLVLGFNFLGDGLRDASIRSWRSSERAHLTARRAERPRGGFRFGSAPAPWRRWPAPRRVSRPPAWASARCTSSAMLGTAGVDGALEPRHRHGASPARIDRLPIRSAIATLRRASRSSPVSVR